MGKDGFFVGNQIHCGGSGNVGTSIDFATVHSLRYVYQVTLSQRDCQIAITPMLYPNVLVTPMVRIVACA